MSGPRVFIAQNDGRFDLSDVRRYGDPCVIFNRDLFPDNANEKAPEALKRAYDMLGTFAAESDFLCLVGSPLYTAICSYVLGDLGKAPVNLLRFDRLESAYYLVRLR